MVFLFNDVLIEVGDPGERLVESGCPITIADLSRMTPMTLLSLVRTAVFEDPDFARSRPEKAAALAALVHLKTSANALVCLRTPNVAGAEDMPLRLAQATLPVLADLVQRQRSGELTPEAIDRAVWSTA